MGLLQRVKAQIGKLGDAFSGAADPEDGYANFQVSIPDLTPSFLGALKKVKGAKEHAWTWNVKEGDVARAGQPIATLNTAKPVEVVRVTGGRTPAQFHPYDAVPELVMPYDGIITGITSEAGSEAPAFVFRPVAGTDPAECSMWSRRAYNTDTLIRMNQELREKHTGMIQRDRADIEYLGENAETLANRAARRVRGEEFVAVADGAKLKVDYRPGYGRRIITAPIAEAAPENSM